MSQYATVAQSPFGIKRQLSLASGTPSPSSSGSPPAPSPSPSVSSWCPTASSAAVVVPLLSASQLLAAAVQSPFLVLSQLSTTSGTPSLSASVPSHASPYGPPEVLAWLLL